MADNHGLLAGGGMTGTLALVESLPESGASDLWEKVPADYRLLLEDPASFPHYGTQVWSRGERLGAAALGTLPESLARELVYGTWWLATDGWKVDVAILRAIARTARSLDPTPGSLLAFSPEEWTRFTRAEMAQRMGRVPTPKTMSGHRQLINNIHSVVEVGLDSRPWWSRDVWNYRLDRRIPIRDHEPQSSKVINFSLISQPWLREGVKLWAKVSLESGDYRWGTLKIAVHSIGGYFSQFVALRGDRGPLLCEDPDSEMNGLALDYVSYLRTAPAPGNARTTRKNPNGHMGDNHLATCRVAMANFYEWMFENRTYAARTLADPRWTDLSSIHAYAFRRVNVKKAAHVIDDAKYIDETAQGRFVACVEILGAPATETFEIEVDGEPRAVQGMGHPQSMRAALLQMMLGRRVSEIVMMPFEPLSPIPGLSLTGKEPDPDAPVARLTYRQTKIDGAQDSILVGSDVVELVRDQQAWVRANYPFAESEPPYLFVALARNRLGRKPLSAQIHAGKLRQFAELVKIADSTGKVIDFGRTHQFRHTRLTDLAMRGVPITVLQRFAGHASAEMTSHYIALRQSFHEEEFLRFKKVSATGVELPVAPEDLMEMVGIGNHTDRVLPNGYCLLPPLKTCTKGNACLTCQEFATDASFVDELRDQLSGTRTLIDSRRARHLEKTGTAMSEENVWLRERRNEVAALELVIDRLGDDEGAQPFRLARGPGVGARTNVKLGATRGRAL